MLQECLFCAHSPSYIHTHKQNLHTTSSSNRCTSQLLKAHTFMLFKVLARISSSQTSPSPAAILSMAAQSILLRMLLVLWERASFQSTPSSTKPWIVMKKQQGHVEKYVGNRERLTLTKHEQGWSFRAMKYLPLMAVVRR